MSSLIGSSVVGSASLLKGINRNVILNQIRQKEPVSRADLVESTGLGFPTVLRIVNALIEEGLVLEIGKGDTPSGRKPIMLSINPKAAHIIGIRVGRRLIVVLTDFNGNIVDEHIEMADFENGPEAVAELSYDIVSAILDRNGLTYGDIAGVGIATPGMDFKTCGNNDNAATLASWQSSDAGTCFFRKFEGCLTKIEFITICGAIGEQWFGKTRDSKNNLYVYVDTGVGGGVIIDGKVYRGEDGFAGHIGHSVIDFHGERCYCGNRGCLETYTSSTYIARRVRRRIQEGAQSSALDIAQGEVSKIRFNSVVTAALQGDLLCMEVLREAGEALGIGLANAINSYNPDKVVLGGEVCWLYPQLVETAIAVARDNTFSNKARKVDITISDIQFYSEAKGAVALIMNEIYKSPNI